MDEQELQSILEKLRNGVELTTEEMNKLAAGADGSTKSLKAMDVALKTAVKGVTDITKKLVAGSQGASVYNDTISDTTNAIGKLASQFGVLGKGVGFLIGAIGGYVQAVNQLSDNLYSTYSKLSKTGVTAADGMTGLAESSVKLGYGLSQVGLEQFTALMSKASQDLALMAGSAADGRKQLARFGGLLADRGPVQQAFGNLGYQVEDLAEMSANYIKQEVAMGRAQQRTDAELAKGTKEYIMQLDQLAKLTGTSVQELQNRMDADLRNERFQSTLLRVERTQGKEAADRMRIRMADLSARFPGLAEGFKDISSGFIQTEAAQKVFRAGLGNVANLMTRDDFEYLNELGRVSKRTVDAMGETLGSVGMFGEVMGPLYEMVRAGTMSQKEYNKIQKDINDATERMARGEDAALDNATKLRIEQIKGRDTMQGLLAFGVAPVTDAMAKLAEVVNYLLRPIEMMARQFGYVPPSAGGAGAAGAGAAAAPGKATELATTGSQMGSTFGPGARIMGGVLGGVTGFFSDLMGGGGSGGAKTDAEGKPQSAADAKNALSFGGGTGSAQNFAGLNPAFRSRIESLAQEYLAATGTPLTINSALRTEADQARLAAQGAPVAKGRSRHLDGLAVDIPEDQKKYLEKSGLLSKYGLTGVSTSPNHIQSLAMGGIATGPKSGYMAQLHGNEAVVPLPDNRSIPVEMPNFSATFDRQIDMMSQQVMRLDELVSLMRNQTSISQQILQVQNN